jgi:uncharacterized protein (UPF0333 family)
MSKFKLYALAFSMLYVTSSDAIVKQSTMQVRLVIDDYCISNANNSTISVVCKGNSPFNITPVDFSASENLVVITY